MKQTSNPQTKVFKYKSTLLTTPKISHSFYSRLGGTSTNPEYQSLNCNTYSSDLPENIENNLKIICNDLNFPHHNLKILKQVHSIRIVHITDTQQNTNHEKADGLVTNIPNILIGVRTADCVPILLYDNKVKVVAAVHAGWKGALGGIIENMILSMKGLNANAENIYAAIGPCIQQSSYEVDQNFYQKFIMDSPINDKFFVRCEQKGYYKFNLPEYCVSRLNKSNVYNIDNLQIDTYTNSDYLFSYRRSTHQNINQKTTLGFGTQLSVIGLKTD